MVCAYCNELLGYFFQKMTEQPSLTQKIKLFSILSKNHIKLKLSQTNQNNKIYNSKNCDIIDNKHKILKFHTKN